MTMSKIGLFGSVVLTGALCACARLETQHVLTGMPGAKHTGPVRIVMEGTPPPPGLLEIAILQVKGSGKYADLQHAVEGFTEKARELGCDHVVNVRVDQGGAMSATGVCARSP
jgi:hypothetical protein